MHTKFGIAFRIQFAQIARVMQAPAEPVILRPDSSAPAGAEVLAVQCGGLVRHLGGQKVLDGISLEIRRGEFFTLLGPSGCGKTTLLRMIAGLDAPNEGSLHILGRNAESWPAHDRPINTVFQSYALFPHLSVIENVRFGPRMRKLPSGEVTARAMDALNLTRMSEYTERMPHQLSGGQKQRVALARALANRPQILLLDEPLAALDLKLRHELQEELRPLQRKLGTTFIYVTHDQEEAMSLSDRIAIMLGGQILQIGTPALLYDHPSDRFTAQFLGGCNVLEAVEASGQWKTEAGIIKISANSMDARMVQPSAGSRIWVGVRPERIQLIEPGSRKCIGRDSNIAPSDGTEWPGVVTEARMTGAHWKCQIAVGTIELRVMVMNAGGWMPVSGDSVGLNVPDRAWRFLGPV